MVIFVDDNPLLDSEISTGEIDQFFARGGNGFAGSDKVTSSLIEGLDHVRPRECLYLERNPQMIGKGLGQVVLKTHGLLTIDIIAVGIAPRYDGYLLGFSDLL